VDSHLRVAGAAPGAVYAAGDAATACAVAAEQPHWHQMRLWSQARALGGLAGTAMAEEGKAGAGGAEVEADEESLSPALFLAVPARLLSTATEATPESAALGAALVRSLVVSDEVAAYACPLAAALLSHARFEGLLEGLEGGLGAVGVGGGAPRLLGGGRGWRAW
jgi:hypothetical protein